MNIRRAALAHLLLLIFPIQTFAMGQMAGCAHAEVFGQLDTSAALHADPHWDAFEADRHDHGPSVATGGTGIGSDADARAPSHAHPCNQCSLCAMCGAVLLPVSADLQVSPSTWLRPDGASHRPAHRDLGSLFRPPLAPVA